MGGKAFRIPIAILLITAGAEGVAGEQPAVSAVWKYRDFDLSYESSVIIPCGTLPLHVATIMRGVGARDDVEVRVVSCWNSFGSPRRRVQEPITFADVERASWRFKYTPTFPDGPAGPSQSARLHVRALLPVEMTPAILTELQQDKARRELVSRVTGDPAARNNHPERFTAQRYTVKLSPESGIDPIACDLVRQMTDSISELGIRIVREGPRCRCNTVSGSKPELIVEALYPVPLGATQLPVIDGGAADAGEPRSD